MTDEGAGPPGRLVLLLTSPRVAPGLLTAAAWDVLRAGRVLAASAAHPQAAALAAAGVALDEAAPDGPALLDAALAVAGRTVVWLGSPDGDPGLVDAVARDAADRTETGRPVPEVEVLPGSYDVPGARLLDLVAVMDRLRSPGGCPWDAAQTHRSLATYLLEETYETLEALETGDEDHLREELGDLLLQVAFHARLAEERAEAPWDIDDVAGGIVDKLVRRHPHVFAGAPGPDAEHADLGPDPGPGRAADPRTDPRWDTRWDELKAAEKGRTSALDGVPLALPALSLAAKVLGRAERAGVPVAPPSPPAGLGDELLALVQRSRDVGLDAEQELRDAVRRYADAVRAAEARGPAAG